MSVAGPCLYNQGTKVALRFLLLVNILFSARRSQNLNDMVDATHPSQSMDNFQPLPSGENREEDPESEDVLTLRPSALSALTAFLDEQQAAREAMVSLAVESHSRSLAGLRLPTDHRPSDNVRIQHCLIEDA